MTVRARVFCLLAVGAWGCGPPQVTAVLPPGVELPRPKPTEEEAAQAVGEYRGQVGVEGLDAAPHALPAVAESTKIGEPRTTKSGLTYETVKEGNGAQAKPGDTVAVHYTGTFPDGKKFDSSRDRGDEPFTFVLYQGMVIAGMDEGVGGMKVGEQRKLTIPPTIGYGDAGKPPAVPPKATLIFEVELMSTHPAPLRKSVTPRPTQ
jgi:FKBP-type peptidyl-prolyl cis-trans isomerase